ncbi:MAG: TonB-dependent receptor [Saprospiraceae bacterium]|nr:TonB-dependent receptor [Saprospiraceae bacterium]
MNISLRFFKYLPTLIFAFSAILAFGQGTSVQENRDVMLRGEVQDQFSGEPLEFVAISVFREMDSLLLTGVISDVDGRFEIELQAGAYFLAFNFIGYQEQIVPGIELLDGEKERDLGIITLSEATTLLDEVEVVGERTQMELKLDKRVYNIGKDVSNTGGSASDVLDNLPSIQVDIEGNVSLRGSEGVRILIDGKPSGLLGGADALRQIPSDMIESVEVVTNPSARYEAEGEVGIINIILKKDKRKGFNGSFGLTTGWPENFGANYGLNFRRKSVNFFSNFGINYRDSPGGGTTYQRAEQDGEVLIFDSEQTRSRAGLNGNIQLGTDFFLNDRNTLTTSVLLKISDGQNDTKYIYRDLNEAGEVLQLTDRLTDEMERSYDFEGALNYRKTFEDEDRLWTVDFKYILTDDTELSDYVQTSDTTETVLNQRSSNTEDEVNYFFQTDYAHPLWENSIAEMGARFSSRRIDNEFLVEEQNSLGDWNVYPGLDNYMIYTENILATYLIFGSDLGAFSYQLGVRAEYSDITTELVKTKEVNPREYLNFFPSVHLTYELDEANQLQLSYSRRINRPRFRHLLPFYSFGDNRNIFAGNPDLNPEFTQSFETGYLHFFDRGSFLTSLYYRYRTDIIERILIPTEDGGSLRLPINLATQHAFGLEGNVSYDFFPWWRNNVNFNFYRAITAGNYEGQDLSADAYTWSGRWNANFKLPGEVGLQMAFDYRAPTRNTQGKDLARYTLDAGVTRDILKGNGTLIFSVRDLFNTRRWNNITDVENFYREQTFQWRSRQFLLTFNYRLNRKKRETDLFKGEGGGEE